MFGLRMRLDRLRLQRPSVSPFRILVAFLVFICISTLYLFALSSNDGDRFGTPVAEAPVPEDVHVKPVTHNYIPSVNVTISPPVDPSTGRANATFVMLARNRDIEGVEKSMHSLESQFNERYNYPWIFLNEVPFSEEFMARAAAATNASVQFGVVPHDDWFMPNWIDEARMQAGKEELEKLTQPYPVPYANSTSYRNMCRFNSGFFFRHELLEPYKWYWRVEPDVEFTCNIRFDPFVYMIENDKRYSFTIALKEVAPTIPSLWNTVKDFRVKHPDLEAKDNAMSFISRTGGETYNLCHFWSNFEIADLDFFRSEHYRAFFDFLDSTGMFYYERWGDAPVHSIAVSLFLPKRQIHFFNEIGYHHAPYEHCPSGSAHTGGMCTCNFGDNFDYWPASCLRNFV